jgi:hypothetical protein
MLPSRDHSLALPVKRAPLCDSFIAPLEISPPCTAGRGKHHYVKECDGVPSVFILLAGATLGSGGRCPRLQSPQVMYCSKSLSASFRPVSFPLRGQIYPLIHAASTVVFASSATPGDSSDSKAGSRTPIFQRPAQSYRFCALEGCRGAGAARLGSSEQVPSRQGYSPLGLNRLRKNGWI